MSALNLEDVSKMRRIFAERLSVALDVGDVTKDTSRLGEFTSNVSAVNLAAPALQVLALFVISEQLTATREMLATLLDRVK